MRYTATTIALMLAVWFGFYAAENGLGHLGAVVTGIIAYLAGAFSHSKKP